MRNSADRHWNAVSVSRYIALATLFVGLTVSGYLSVQQKCAEVFYSRALKAASEGNFAEASDFLKHLCAIDSHDAYITELRALWLANADPSTNVPSDDTEWDWILSIKPPSGALRLFSLAAMQSPRDARFRGNYGFALYLSGSHREGTKELIAAHALAPLDVEVLIQLIMVTVKNAEYDRATKYGTLLIQLQPRLLRSAWFRAYSQRCPHCADIALRDATFMLNYSITVNRSPLLLARRASIYAFTNRLSLAKADLDAALVALPTLSEAWAQKGWVLEQMKNRREALDDYQLALTLDPHSSTAHYGLCRLLGSGASVATTCQDTFYNADVASTDTNYIENLYNYWPAWSNDVFPSAILTFTLDSVWSSTYE